MNEDISFEVFLNEKMKEHRLSPKQLSELSGISIKHIEAICRGRLEEAPAAPYLRGYLIALGRIMDFDGEAWWEKVKIDRSVANSGPTDTLPENRFLKSAYLRRWFIAGAVLLLILVYAGSRYTKILGEPGLAITNPKETSITTQNSDFILQGTLTDGDELSINGDNVPLQNDGSWEKELTLQPGVNILEVVAKKFLGRSVTETRRIVYEPPVAPTSSPSIIR